MPFAHIIGTGCALPERVLTNQDLEQFIDTSDEWITRRSGIKERRIASKDRNETTSQLGLMAAQRALQTADISADQIDTIIAATVSGDRLFPSTACSIQKELAANNAAAYDISAGCSGFVYGLELGNNSIRAGVSKTILLIGTERLSSVLNWQDRSTCVLLGDGAGAVVIRSLDEPGGILSTHIKSDGGYWDLLYAEDGNTPPPAALEGLSCLPHHLKMEGNRLFKQAVPSMVKIAEQALEHNGLTCEEIALMVPHQANVRILQAVAERLKIPIEKVYTNLHKYGNTSSASIPIAMDEAYREGRIKKGDRVLLVAFGAGLTWGSSIIEWSI